MPSTTAGAPLRFRGSGLSSSATRGGVGGAAKRPSASRAVGDSDQASGMIRLRRPVALYGLPDPGRPAAWPRSCGEVGLVEGVDHVAEETVLIKASSQTSPPPWPAKAALARAPFLAERLLNSAGAQQLDTCWAHGSGAVSHLGRRDATADREPRQGGAGTRVGRTHPRDWNRCFHWRRRPRLWMPRLDRANRSPAAASHPLPRPNTTWNGRARPASLGAGTAKGRETAPPCRCPSLRSPRCARNGTA